MENDQETGDLSRGVPDEVIKTENTIKILKLERDQLKNSLKRFAGFLHNFSDGKIENLELRLRAIDGVILNQFTDVQNKIDMLSTAVDQTEIIDFEDLYFECTSKAVKIIRNFYENTSNIMPNNIPNVQNSLNQNQTSRSMNPLSSKSLPTIELIKFSGEYDKWAQFRDLFKNLVHEDPCINRVKKFYYLISSLKGEAARVVEEIEITEQNYELAWNLLNDRFDNKHLTIKNHVKALFDLQAVSRDKYTLRNLLDDFQKRCRALKTLGEPVEHWSTLLIHILSSKLDGRTLTQWEEFVIRQKINNPELDDMLSFLADKCKLFETTATDTQKRTDKNIDNKKYDRKQVYISNEGKNQSQPVSRSTYVPRLECSFCKLNHHIYRCEKLINLPLETRILEIKKLHLCLNCLRANHTLNQCVSQGCKLCSKRHNTLLHEPSTSSEQTNEACSPNVNQIAGIAVNHSAYQESEVLLSTATVLVRNNDGVHVRCRALLDSGSQSNFMTRHLANKLNLPLYESNMPIVGIGESTNQIKNRVKTEIKSVNNRFEISANFLVIDRITDKLPSKSFNKSLLNLPNGTTLADEHFNTPKHIDLLLGATIFYQTLGSEQRQFGSNHPILQSTTFGWVVAGPLPTVNPINKTRNNVCNLAITNLENQMCKFWEIEEYPIKKHLSAEETKCEVIFQKALKRDIDGRFIVKLPIRETTNLLGDSLESALKRLTSIERKFRKNPEFKRKYVEFMREYQDLGHMIKIKSDNVIIENTGKNLFYLPHHGVLNENSSTTSLRVVFDASCPTSSGTSLNDLLMVGATIQEELFSILVRFRQYSIVLTADVAKMYRQVRIDSQQCDLQRIVWRENSDEEISHFRLKTVTYGTASASFLATRALQQAALEMKNKFPKSANIILTDFYVDDLITGTNDQASAIQLKSEISSILGQFGFPLRKWVSNNPKAIGQDRVESSDKYYLHEGDINRTLGLIWHAKSDIISYNVKPIKTSKITKRIILSATSSIFDPFGLLAPITIRSKILMQKIWQCKEGWDSPLPSDINNSWLNLVDDLQYINEIIIPRQVIILNAKYVELHSFCDASQAAYGACIYVRSIDSDGKCFTQLLCAKSRVAPLKTITIPRLELCGAVLAVKLMERVKTALRLKIDKCVFWTDSTIVLGWIGLAPSNLKLFVANRVAEIQCYSDASQWNHVPTNENPADLISRGSPTLQVKSSGLWWSGPDWLQDITPNNWPQKPEVVSESIPEVKNNKVLFVKPDVNTLNIFERFSSFYRLLRVVAYCYRFYENCKNKTRSENKTLTVNEINCATLTLTKLAQREMFPHEFNSLRISNNINKKSKLVCLNPIMDLDGLLRVGGRISKSNLPFESKHQIILSPNHTFTRLLIVNEHKKNLHAGSISLLSILREKYWILQGRRAIRSALKGCITCFRVNPTKIIQKMGDLPTDRVTQYRTFYVTGIDFAGPFLIKDGKLRNRAIIKAYLCIFICFTTKAVHLEAVGDLGSDAFLHALKRFVARRGLPKTIYTDNGTNFTGTCNELKAIFKAIPDFVQTPSISDFLLKNRITWKFIPPRSPHHGGLWEAAVKRAKYHIVRVIGKNHLTFEKLSTLFAQVEAAINSAPITPLSNDPSDLSCLTPGHFLIGTPLLSIPEPDLINLPANRLSQYQVVQQMFQSFWQRWSRDYLLSLQQRSKWQSITATDSLPRIGSMVLLVEENTPPLYWRLGRVTEVHPGKDNILRVVTLQTSSGITTRAVQKLALLPIDV